METLGYATLIGVVLAVVLAVSRDVPVLEAFLPPPGRMGDATDILIGFPALACFAIGFWRTAWLLALLYGSFGVGWRLWRGA
jgi:hypothetical protein